MSLSEPPSALPVGTVTFLMTDVEGSTQLWERLPAAMSDAMRRHHSIVHNAIRNLGGELPPDQGEGDSVLGAFKDAQQAVRCAIQVQQALSDETWPEQVEIRVRIGVHTGEGWANEDGNYLGTAIIRCARVRSFARGRQILISRTTRERCGTSLPLGATLIDRGVHRLKHLSRPEHLTEVRYPGLGEEFPPISPTWEVPNNLQEELTSFVGRRVETEALTEELARARLVTIVGPGGIGKTRLATHVARQMLDSFPDGIWFLDLASRSDLEDLPEVIAGVLGIPGPGVTDAQDELRWLAQGIRKASLLLIFDNCEHVVDEVAATVESLLRLTSGPKVLATSRESLRATGERVHMLTPLELPDDDLSVSQLSDIESVRLLLDRAQEHSPGLDMSSEDSVAVVQICRRLEGIPLAIELLAPRLRDMHFPEVIAAMEDRFTLLSKGSRTAPHRQQTLLNLLDWSYELLDEEEQSLFRSLAVFVGGFSIEAAATVCSEVPNTARVAEVMSRLVDKSLVMQTPGLARSRFAMLETTASYAAEKLNEAGDSTALRDRDLSYFMELGEERGDALRISEDPDWKDLLQLEEPNLLVALEWARVRNDYASSARLSGALWMFWDVRGQYEHGRKWLRYALSSERLEPEAEIRAQAGASFMSLSLADPGGVRQHAHRAISLWRQIGEPSTLAWFATWVLCDLAFASLLGDDTAGALEPANEALRTAQLAHEPSAQTRALYTLGFATQPLDLQAAERFYQQALALARQHDMQLGKSRTLTRLAEIALGRQEIDAAMAIFKEVIEITRSLDDKAILGNALLRLAALEDVTGSETAATRLRQEGQEILQSIGLTQEIGSILAEAAERSRGTRDGHVRAPESGKAGG
jgi:predicted ATPase/class 3 adenylate cyclase